MASPDIPIMSCCLAERTSPAMKGTNPSDPRPYVTLVKLMDADPDFISNKRIFRVFRSYKSDAPDFAFLMTQLKKRK